jgi:bifunctional ADP-heptose synthase (sugar kinase/adenylyltransferase)
LGKSSKDPVLAAHFLSRDMFAGGALAVANHVSNFAGQTTLATVLAKDCPYSDFVRKGLNENIKKSIHLRDSSVTTLKRRFIDDQSLVKMFEIYEMDNAPMPQELESSVCSELEDLIPKADLVLVADFGHGTITPTMRKLICEKARYLAVNTQANAGNRGYHTISLYPRADCVVLAEHEARLACQDLYSELRPLTQRIQRRLNCRHVVVTRGRKGVALMSDTGEFTQVPAFIAEQVDSVGSGDALLSVLSQCACLDLPQQVMGLIGNAAGALTVKFVGNSQSVGKQQLKKFLLAQLK